MTKKPTNTEPKKRTSKPMTVGKAIDKLLDELRRECPFLIAVVADHAMRHPGNTREQVWRELAALINRHRAEAYEAGRNEERPRDAIDM